MDGSVHFSVTHIDVAMWDQSSCVTENVDYSASRDTRHPKVGFLSANIKSASLTST